MAYQWERLVQSESWKAATAQGFSALRQEHMEGQNFNRERICSIPTYNDVCTGYVAI